MLDETNPQQWNGYAYGDNSPITFSDPTGLIATCGVDGAGCANPNYDKVGAFNPVTYEAGQQKRNSIRRPIITPRRYVRVGTFEDDLRMLNNTLAGMADAVNPLNHPLFNPRALVEDAAAALTGNDFGADEDSGEYLAGGFAMVVVPGGGLRGLVGLGIKGGAAGLGPVGGGKASTPLTAEVKNALRTEARDIWQNVSGRRAIWDKLEVHHRIPLEWTHLFPGNPNRVANLVGMEQQAHRIVTESWRVWKVGLGGRMPRPAEILGQALAVDKRYGVSMVFPK